MNQQVLKTELFDVNLTENLSNHHEDVKSQSPPHGSFTMQSQDVAVSNQHELKTELFDELLENLSNHSQEITEHKPEVKIHSPMDGTFAMQSQDAPVLIQQELKTELFNVNLTENLSSHHQEGNLHSPLDSSFTVENPNVSQSNQQELKIQMNFDLNENFFNHQENLSEYHNEVENHSLPPFIL